MDVASLLFGYSKALYSTWLYYKPDHLLIDCGEGASTSLGNSGFAIERILLTHGHIDHISGLPSLLWSRAAGMGDTQKPLFIYYPEGDEYIADMRSYLKRTSERLPFALHWVPLGDGDCFTLEGTAGHHRGGRCIETFATRHRHNQLTLGYKIVESRRRLKPDHAGLSEEEIRQRARQDGPAATHSLMEDYTATLAVFGGDGLPLDPATLGAAELLVHEATILDDAERKHQLHSTVREAVGVAAAAHPKALLINHVSGRYRGEEIRRAIFQSAIDHQIDCPVWSLVRDRLCKTFEPIGFEGEKHEKQV